MDDDLDKKGILNHHLHINETYKRVKRISVLRIIFCFFRSNIISKYRLNERSFVYNYTNLLTMLESCFAIKQILRKLSNSFEDKHTFLYDFQLALHLIKCLTCQILPPSNSFNFNIFYEI